MFKQICLVSDTAAMYPSESDSDTDNVNMEVNDNDLVPCDDEHDKDEGMDEEGDSEGDEDAEGEVLKKPERKVKEPSLV
jgi:hypothetical protein